jgi:hypothetical protein
MGNTAMDWGAVGTGGNNRIFISSFPLASSASLTELSFYVDNIVGGSGLNLGVYSDGGGIPGILIAETGAFAGANGWNSASLPGTPLTPGTYWLAAFIENPIAIGYSNGNSTWIQNTGAFGALPGSLPSPSFNSGTTSITIYGSACFQTPTTTPTITQSHTLTETYSPTLTETYSPTLTETYSPTLTETYSPTLTETYCPTLTET